jgi:hypothetical protein
VRYQRPILVAALVLVPATVAWALLSVPAGLRDLAHLPLGLLGIGFIGPGALIAQFRGRPARLDVDPRVPAFRTPPHAVQICSSVGGLLCAENALLYAVSPPPAMAHGGWWLPLDALRVEIALLSLVATVALAAAAVLLLRRGGGLLLRPDAVVAPGPFGTLTVPWDALAPGYPAPPDPKADRLTLAYARPELARRRGFAFPRSVPVGDADARFLADVIRWYAGHPKERGAIGTPDGYARLMCRYGVTVAEFSTTGTGGSPSPFA